jgi:chromosome segregation ATPase
MADRDEYKKKTPPAGVQVQVAPETSWDDVTGQHDDPNERARLRSQRVHNSGVDIEIAHLSARLDAGVEHRAERFDRIDHALDRIDQRLNNYSERVIRAEHGGQAAWEAVKNLGPQLQQVVAISGDIKRIADSVDRLATRADGHDTRLRAIETEQELASQKFDLHDKRDQEMQLTLDRVDTRVGQLEVARAVDDITNKHKLVARVRPWWFSAKGVAAVVAAIAAAATGIIAASSGGCG